MRENLKTVLITTLILLVVLLSIKTDKCYQEARKQPKTIYLTDTIVNVEWDTVYLERYKTIKLPVVDTTVYYITDTVVRLDSIEVEVPISKYSVDTTFFTDTTQLNLSIRNSGFNVKLDSLSYKFEYTPTSIKLPKKNYFREHFKFGVGAGAGYGCFSKQPDIFIGGGFYYCF